MNKRNKTFLAAAAAVVILGAGGAAVAGNIADDHEVPITGEALERATAAALAFTGGGRVSETEVGDEDSFYEVEVTMPDGRQIDVQLDQNFNVVGSKVDQEDDDRDGS